MAKIAVEIPGYELERLIGRGGMAEVYVARQISLGRKVALKILLQTLSPDAHFATRFEREARTAAALQHPNIIKIFDTGIYNGRYYIAMEYLGSRTVRNLIIEGMPPDLAVEYLIKLANALDYAHTKGVIHRDIKPTNILLYHDNEPVLSDFGISRLVDSNSTLTATGMMLGSPRYISPEQARGGVIDSRSDLYALGAIFYEMLTGTAPYETEDTLALMYMHVNDAIPRLPPELNRYQPVIDGLMAKKPEQRLATAGEIFTLLDDELDHTSQFSDTGETRMFSPEQEDSSISQISVAHTPGSADSGDLKMPLCPTDSHPGGHPTLVDESTPDANIVPPAQASTRNGRPYSKYALLAVMLIIASGLYWFLVPPNTQSPPLTDSIEDIVKQLEDKVNAGDFEAARALLGQGLSMNALDHRLLAFVERVRTGIKQQNEAKAVDKTNKVERLLVTAKDLISSAEYDKASALIVQAKDLGADQVLITAIEHELAQAQEGDITQKQYAALLVQSRTALQNDEFYTAEQAAKKAMALKPEATEIKQLLITIELARSAAKRKQKLAALESDINQSLKMGEIDKAREIYDLLKREHPEASVISRFDSLISRKELARSASERKKKLAALESDINQSLEMGETEQARKTFELLKLENPEASVISRFDSLIASKEKESKMRELFDKQFHRAKTSYAQGHLMQGLAAVERALSVNPEDAEAQSLLQTIRLEREQKIAELKQEILSTIVVNDLSGAKKSLGKLKRLGASVAEIDSHIASLEQRQTDALLSLTVKPIPADARIRILNIGPAYRPGIKLQPDRYKIEVSKAGYEQHVSVFELKQGQQEYSVELEIAPLEIAPLEKVPPKIASDKQSSEQASPTLQQPFIEPEMVRIAGGWFQMGCVSNRGCKDNEKPVHDVQVASFEIGKHEVTFDEWDRCYEAGGCSQRLSDQRWGRGKRPAINVSWKDTQEYVKWLSQQTGIQYRLPSEAEWEYAARAGTTGSYSFSGKISVEKANYDGNYTFDRSPEGIFREQTLPVGSFPPNPWGLYDIHGNAWEWVQDCLHENYDGAPSIASAWTTDGDCGKRGLRGGSWNSQPSNLRSANRGWFITDHHYFIDGFRLIRPLQ